MDHLFWRKTILLTGVTPELETPDLSQILTLRQICRKITAYVDGILKIWLDERAPLFDMMASVQRRWENGRLMCNPHMVMIRIRKVVGNAIERRRIEDALTNGHRD